MRLLFIVGLCLFTTNAIALDLKGKIEALKAKAASGQNIAADLAALTKEAEANSQSIAVTQHIDISLIDNDGKVSLFLPGKKSTTFIANSKKHEKITAEAINKHPQAKEAHAINEEKGETLGGGTKQPAASDQSSGGFGHLLQSIFGGILSIGGDVVSGAIGGVVEAVV